MPRKIDHQAIHIARQYLGIRDYLVEDLSTNRENKGYDLIATRGTETLKIRVKGCARPWDIPDLDATDFDAEKRLVADCLYVVYVIGRKEPKLCIIPREALKPEFVIPKSRYRISSRFKNETTLKPFLRAI